MVGQRIQKLANMTLRVTTTTVRRGNSGLFTTSSTQNDPYVMDKKFDPPITPEALERMSFEEKYEGFCVDLIKVISLNLLWRI